MSFTSGPPAATYETMPILALAPAVRAASASGIVVAMDGVRSLLLAITIGPGGVPFDAVNRLEFMLCEPDDAATGV
jgi:hypothetical protein